MLSRRHFIKNAALALPAYSLAGFLLSACNKNNLNSPKPLAKIGIIGAGISGLHAAKLLMEKHQCGVEILEAGDRIGGRIQSENKAFGQFNVEMGASAIYGEDAEWIQWMKNSQAIEINNSTATNYFIQGEVKTQSEIQSDPDYVLMQTKLLSMPGFNGTNDMSVGSYMQLQGVPEKVKFIFEEISEEITGTSVNRASVKLNRNESISKIGDPKYLPGNESFDKLLFKQYGQVLPYVLTNTAITSIDYSGDQVKVTDKNQVVRSYDKVIVTVPLSILKLEPHQANSIRFNPALPQAKKEAMSKLGMDSGVRIILKLNKKFWGHHVKTIYTKGQFGKFEVLKEDLISNQFVLGTTVSGEMAENNLDMISENEIIELIKSEWKTSIHADAANSIVDYKIKFWSKEPYIQGTFSYHKVGGDINTRKELAKQVNDKLFFAGEACNSSHKSGSIRGAMDTAVEVAQALAESGL